MNNYQGWLSIYKPVNITSFGVIKKINALNSQPVEFGETLIIFE